VETLTPLERMFVEEFCRVRDADPSAADLLRVLERSSNPTGFIAEIAPSSVAEPLKWGDRVYDCHRIAVVGPEKHRCGMLLFFDEVSMKLSAIEGHVFGEEWPKLEEPAYWSEDARIVGAVSN
jgi:hypothetical protein